MKPFLKRFCIGLALLMCVPGVRGAEGDIRLTRTDAGGIPRSVIAPTTAYGVASLNLASAAAGRTYFGVVIGTNVQAHDADLDIFATITPGANVQSLLGADDYSAIRTLLSLNLVNNTSDANKPVSTAAQTALDLKASLAALVAVNGGGINVGGKIDWTQMMNVPAGFADGTDAGGSGDALVADPLSQFASTTSAQLAGVLSNETGTSLAVFSEAPTINAANLTGTTTATTVAVTMLVPSAVTWGSTVMPSANGGAGTINGILMANGSGTTSLAVSGTNYEPARTAISQADAEAGVATTVQGFTAQRVAQAIAALGAGGDSIPAGAAISWPTTGIGSPPTGYFAAGEYGTPAQVETGLWSKVVRSAGTIGAFTFSPAAGAVADGATISFVTGGGVAGTTFRHTFGDGTQAAPTFTTGTAGASAVISGAGTYKVTEIKAGYVSATGSAAYTIIGSITPPDIAGLVAWYKTPISGSTNNTATDWADSAGSYNLSAASKPIYKTALVNGIDGVEFNGTSARLNVGGSGSSTYPITIVAVVYARGTAVVTIAGSAGGAGGAQFRIEQTTSYLGFNNQNVAAVYTNTTAVSRNAWHVVAVKATSSTCAFWLDGATAGSNAHSVALTAARTFTLGFNASSSAEFLDGDIAEVAIYSTAVSDSDIVSLSNALKTKYGI